MSGRQTALTPRAKGTGAGREVLTTGPYIMSPSGNFHPAPTAFDMVVEDEEQGPEEFAFPMEEDAAPPASQNSSTADVKVTSSFQPPAIPKVARSTFESRQLFGGAITMSLPASFEDVSVIRVVPDHQEVFVDRISDMSLIIEILGYESEVSDNDAAQHFFHDLAQCNEVWLFVL